MSSAGGGAGGGGGGDGGAGGGGGGDGCAGGGGGGDSDAGGAVLLLRSRDRVEVPWRNGGGTTTVVASAPGFSGGGADPDWRVSVATIAGSGRFSAFPGIDRVLVPLSPAGLALDVGGRIRQLPQFGVIEFAGEEGVAAVEVAEPGDDLNLMTRRGAFVGAIEVCSIEGARCFCAGAGETLLLVVLGGDVCCDPLAADPLAADPPAADPLAYASPLLERDALLLTPDAAIELSGRGTVAILSIRRV